MKAKKRKPVTAPAQISVDEAIKLFFTQGLKADYGALLYVKDGVMNRHHFGSDRNGQVGLLEIAKQSVLNG